MDSDKTVEELSSRNMICLVFMIHGSLSNVYSYVCVLYKKLLIIIKGTIGIFV